MMTHASYSSVRRVARPWRPRCGARRACATAIVVGIALGACRPEAPHGDSARTVDTAGRTPVAALAATGDSLGLAAPRITGDLGKVRWIEGSWRGDDGKGAPPFYERYTLVDDSTLVLESFTDSTMTSVHDVTRYALRDSTLTSVPGREGAPTPRDPRWVATKLTADSVHFEPLANASNAFVWRRSATKAEWVAVLSWPADGDRPARTATYTMRRWH